MDQLKSKISKKSENLYMMPGPVACGLLDVPTVINQKSGKYTNETSNKYTREVQ